jgi:hypothetical protein
MKGGEIMEKMMIGLSLEELEGQTAQLLPDRLEMHKRNRRRRRRGGGGITANCPGVGVAFNGGEVENETQCIAFRV